MVSACDCMGGGGGDSGKEPVVEMSGDSALGDLSLLLLW